MKKNFFLIMCLASIMFACQKEELKYSCSPEIDNWVKVNMKSIVNMDRSEIVKHDLEKQKAIFEALAPEQRYNLWVSKFEQVLTLDLECDNLEHIEALKNDMKIEWFDEKWVADTDNRNNVDTYLKDWSIYALEKLGWSRDFLGCISVRLEDVEDLGGGQYALPGGIGPYMPANRGATPLYDCECSTSNDWCFVSGRCKKTGTCNVTSFGCGLIWAYSCDGECRLFDLP